MGEENLQEAGCRATVGRLTVDFLWFGGLQAFDGMELFAGNANVCRAMRRKGYRTGKLDIQYSTRKPGRRSNYMDLTSASGFLCLA